MKSLLVACDGETIMSVLLRVYQIELELGLARESAGGMDPHHDKSQTGHVHEREESPSKLSIIAKEVKPEQPISILDIKGSKPLDQT